MNYKSLTIIVNDDTPELVNWHAACVKLCEDYKVEHGYNKVPNLAAEKLEISQGTRYIKISRIGPKVNSVWAFVDRTNGNVLKPATWRAPAKHARGNIFDANGGMASMSSYGPAYLR